MSVTDEMELARLVRAARDEDAAVADLEACLGRLHRARAAQSALAALPADQLRTALTRRRADLQAGRP
jgi:thioredoxin-like negative regulator of GroEL